MSLRFKRTTGITLVEVMTAVAVITFAVAGASAYRYFCVLDAQNSEVKITASKLGWTFLQGWKGHSGISTFDPSNKISFIGVSGSNTGPAVPSGFSGLDSGANYSVTLEGVNFYATLSYKDETDYRVLNVRVGWPQDYKNASSFPAQRFITVSTYTPVP
jgi:hypothetical protein